MTGTYNIVLVALSFAIAIVASYTALDLAGRLQFTRTSTVAVPKATQSSLKWRRLFWLLGGAVAMGTGIWSMHFVAMLAFVLPQPVNYNVWVTLFSLLCAISASGIALWLLSRASNLLILIIGGICMGIGIAWMHYTGMAAMQLQAHIRYDWAIVGLSVAIAIIASFAALWLASGFQNESLKGQLQKFGSALVMGVAISAMHYTGMWATHFIPQQQLLAEHNPIFNSFWLAIAIGIATLSILSVALLTALFDQRLAAQLVREQALQESEERFRTIFEEAPIGMNICDLDGRFIQINQKL